LAAFVCVELGVQGTEVVAVVWEPFSKVSEVAKGKPPWGHWCG